MTDIALSVAAPRVAARKLLATLHDDIACVSQRDPAARGALEVLLLYPGVHALIGTVLRIDFGAPTLSFLAASSRGLRGSSPISTFIREPASASAYSSTTAPASSSARRR